MDSSSINFIYNRFECHANDIAIVWNDTSLSYQWLLESIQTWLKHPEFQKIPPGAVVSLEADFTPQAVAILLALIEKHCIIAPLNRKQNEQNQPLIDIAQAEFRIFISELDFVIIQKTNHNAEHPLIDTLRAKHHPGLLLFTSGSSSGKKAVLHDFCKFLQKFKRTRFAYRTIPFLRFDHIGGINTLLYILSNAGCMVSPTDREPEITLNLIEKHNVQLLPTTPTFLNMVLQSDAYKHYALPTLQLVTYGTEPMPKHVLSRFREIYPHIRLLQTYGLTEVGILRSKSKSSESLWVKVGGDEFQTRVIDGVLEVKTESAMMGYLNGPLPFSEDGWFRTGDAVDVDGDYIRILGRQSEIIHVNGYHVYPAQVESVIQTLEEVEEALVYAETTPNPGQRVCAKIKLNHSADPHTIKQKLFQYCRDRLKSYMIPEKITFVDHSFISERMKKQRV